jgi:hypothetical protein
MGAKGPYLIDSGGANRIMVSCVGFARMPLSLSLMQISYAEAGYRDLLLRSTALSKPLPRISLII